MITSQSKRKRAAKRASRPRYPKLAAIPDIRPLTPDELEAHKSPIDRMLDGLVPSVISAFQLAVAKLNAPQQTNSEHVRAKVANALRNRSETIRTDGAGATFDWTDLRMIADILDPSPNCATVPVEE